MANTLVQDPVRDLVDTVRRIAGVDKAVTELERAQTRLLILIATAVSIELDPPGSRIGSNSLAQRIAREVASIEKLLGDKR